MWDRHSLERIKRVPWTGDSDLPRGYATVACAAALIALIIGTVFTVIQANEMRDIRHVGGVVVENILF